MAGIFEKKSRKEREEFQKKWKLPVEILRRFSELVIVTGASSMCVYYMKDKFKFGSELTFLPFRLAIFVLYMVFTVYFARKSMKRMHHHKPYYIANMVALSVLAVVTVAFGLIAIKRGGGLSVFFDFGLNVNLSFVAFAGKIKYVTKTSLLIAHQILLLVVLHIAPPDWFYYATRRSRKKLFYKRHPNAVSRHRHHHHHHSDEEKAAPAPIEYIEEIDSKFI